jgi:hypothetical protein
MSSEDGSSFYSQLSSSTSLRAFTTLTLFTKTACWINSTINLNLTKPSEESDVDAE